MKYRSSRTEKYLANFLFLQIGTNNWIICDVLDLLGLLNHTTVARKDRLVGTTHAVDSVYAKHMLMSV